MADYTASMVGGAAAAYKFAQIGPDGLLDESLLRSRRRNRIVNGAMRISQERGSASTVVPSGTAIYPADQWAVRHNISGLGLNAQQVAKVAPSGSPNRIRLTVSAGATASGSLTLSAPIEGTDVADLLFGTAGARAVAGRIGINAPAGTYTIGLRNGGANRFIGQSFTISAAQAGTDLVVPFAFAGDTSGTWATDTGLGMEMVVTLASSTTVAPGAWAASGGPGVTGQTNGAATTNAVFEIFDAGLYDGPAPSFDLPTIAEDTRACQRFYEPFGIGLGGRVTNATTIAVPGGAFRVSKRVAPNIILTTTAPQIIETDQGYRTGSGSVLTPFNATADGVALLSINGFSGLGTGNQVSLTMSALAAVARLI